ncbi:hypothetical protein GCM10010207_46590 [Streptomyces atratus]|uniref:hypothetical protein n=1 Tax=Streptomyces atratus TaxID=1893 RepID=UPI00166FAB26|nr:hypothetical protein [Streptomyces atratus]GGT41108.1 hypothetical protein GCM10010207_46590 [Streptomyces atratus]
MGQSDPGAESSAYSLGVLGGMGAVGAVAPGAVGELVTELSSFTKFRDRIDGLLRDLRASPAGPGKVGEDTMERERFGGGKGEWTEADGLYKSYSTVIKELEGLSQLLSDSIEGMSIAVLGSHKGYESVDLDVRQRMLAIKHSTETHHQAEQAAMDAAAKNAYKPPATSEDPGDTSGTQAY